MHFDDNLKWYYQPNKKKCVPHHPYLITHNELMVSLTDAWSVDDTWEKKCW